MGAERKYSYIYVYPSIDLICPPILAVNPTQLCNVETVFVDAPWYTQIQSPDPLPTKCDPLPFHFISNPHRFFFHKEVPQTDLRIRNTNHMNFFFEKFLLPQLPPPARTSLLPPSTLIPL